MLRPGFVSRYGGTVVGTPFQDAVQADSPYRYWKDWAASPVADAVANAGDLTMTGAVMNQTGPLTSGDTKAGTFDGVDDCGSAALDLSDTAVITVEFWLWWDAFSNNDDLAMEFSSTVGNNGSFQINPNYGAGGFVVTIKGAGGFNSASFTRPSAAAWHLYAFVLDRGTAAATEVVPYVDGAAISYTKPDNSDNADNFANSTLNVMCRNQASLFGAGRMAHLVVYKSALSAARVAAHWAAR